MIDPVKLDQIKQVFSQEIKTVCVHNQGEDFGVIEINHAWMFRFPRNVSARQALQQEKEFLPRLARISPVPIPQPEYVGDDFIGYRKIEGVLLTPQCFRTLRRETQRTIAKQIGGFLSVLHTFPLAEARRLGLSEGWNRWHRKAYQSFLENVAPLLSTVARENALRFLDQFLALQWRPVVIHGDVYPADHLFFDEARQQLSGVIDFGDLTILDAARDFRYLFSDLGEDFFGEVLAHYSGEIDPQLVHRIKMRIQADPLFDAPYALEYHQPERFKKTSCGNRTRLGD